MFSGLRARNTELRANSCITMSQATFKMDEKSIPSVACARYYFAAPGSWKALQVPKPVKVICLCRRQDNGNPPRAPRAAPVQQWRAPVAAVTTGDGLISGFRCSLFTPRSWKCLRSNIVKLWRFCWFYGSTLLLPGSQRSVIWVFPWTLSISQFWADRYSPECFCRLWL